MGVRALARELHRPVAVAEHRRRAEHRPEHVRPGLHGPGRSRDHAAIFDDLSEVPGLHDVPLFGDILWIQRAADPGLGHRSRVAAYLDARELRQALRLREQARATCRSRLG
jgi:hypothetical protein